MQRSVWRLVALVSSFCVAALVAVACGEQDYPTTAFHCDPSGTDPCPSTHVCCSTDPASLDLANPTGEVLPDYAGGSGAPVFSGRNNGRSKVGRCVAVDRVGEIEVLGEDEGDAAGCPRPCNPTWSDADVVTVCGADAFCCPTQELGEKDCVFDPGVGVAGCWRPIEGRDIETLGGLDATTWASTAHDTHQDPRGRECKDFVESLEPGASPASAEELERACYQRLSVANQRGLCTPAEGAADIAEVCALADPNHRDACEAMNDENELIGCEVVDYP